jgi:hypothetical protein
VKKAVLNFAMDASNHRRICEIRAVVALVSVLSHLVSILQQICWLKTLNRNQCCHGLKFVFHLRSLSDFEIVPDFIGFKKFELGSLAKVCSFEVDYVLDREPLEREHRNFLSCSSVDVLGLHPVFKPGAARKIDCFTDVESC